jgi:hypothetical protein
MGSYMEIFVIYLFVDCFALAFLCKETKANIKSK